MQNTNVCCAQVPCCVRCALCPPTPNARGFITLLHLIWCCVMLCTARWCDSACIYVVICCCVVPRHTYLDLMPSCLGVRCDVAWCDSMRQPAMPDGDTRDFDLLDVIRCPLGCAAAWGGRFDRTRCERASGAVLHRFSVQLCAGNRRVHLHPADGSRCPGRLRHV